PITTTRWVKAIEVRPGASRVFHHANVVIDRSRSSRRQERVAGAGFPGMDLNVEEDTFDPDGHFLSWKPGSEPVVEPDGMAWRADPGMVLEGYAMLPDGTKKWLIRIPDWDLNWQGVYRLKQRLRLPKGTVVSMRYHYDNSADNVRNPSSPPRTVKGGNQATDEMGHLWLQVLPVGGGDQRAALQEGLMRQRLEKYPDDFTANFNVGDMLMNRQDAAGAVPYFEAAVRSNPISIVANTELGLALFAAGKLPEAEDQLKRAVALAPAYADARYDLASVQAARGNWDDAASEFKRVLGLRPDDAKARQHLAEALYLWGDSLAEA